MRTWLTLAGLLLAGGLVQAQRIRAVFGLLEGTGGPSYPNSGLYFRQEDLNTGTLIAGITPLPGVEPMGNDLAYDPNHKLLFVIGGGIFPTWEGSVYALDVWHNLIPMPVLPSIKARRLAVKDTLLLVTRQEAPFFTVYRIRYEPAQGLQVDSLWSPTSPLLRNTPDGLLVWGDTAYLALSYDPTTYTKDSLVLAINLQTRQVVASWTVYPNPTEIVRIGNALYVACYGDFSGNLQISQIQPNSPIVTTYDAGYPSYGGFVTDTGGVKDTILYWSGNTLRAFAVTAGQTAPGAYLGIASTGFPFTPYGLLWVGKHLHLSFTNFTDTSLIVIRDPDLWPTPPYLDTVFVSMGIGGIGYPGLRRFLYVEDDTARVTTGLSAGLLRDFTYGPNPTTHTLTWASSTALAHLSLWDATGRPLRTYPPTERVLFLGDLPAGLYFLHIQTQDGRHQSYPILKE